MNKMKTRYRLIHRGLRGGMFYRVDKTTGKRASLHTTDPDEAARLLAALNEAGHQPAINLSLARVYLRHSDPLAAVRTWQHVMAEIINSKTGENQVRWQVVAKSKKYDSLRPRLLIDTQAEHLFRVLNEGTVSTNVYLRRMHNFALDMNWLPASVIPRRQWPPVRFKDKRAITLEEHQQILAAERNPERKALYQLCWHLGASQGDIASLKGEDVDWTVSGDLATPC